MVLDYGVGEAGRFRARRATEYQYFQGFASLGDLSA
jgi:hypothetical protein